MKCKKIISLLLVFTMVLSLSTVAFASEEKAEYVPAYDTETPVVIVHGMSQNDTYLLDENGERVPDENGYVTGWPLEIDVMALVKVALPKLLISIFTGKDAGLTEAMKKGAYEALYVLHKDNEGNYLADIEVPCPEKPMSELPQDLKDLYYYNIPVQQLGDIIGEENMYYFGYDSFGNVKDETEKLHHYIHNVVLPQTGASKISLCPISLGGTIATNYLEMYPEDYKLIKKMVFIAPALDGSDIIGDILTGNLSVFYDDNMLYEELLVTLLGDTYLAYLLNVVLRILPTDVLKSALAGLVEGVINSGIRTTTIMWALCPTDYYEEAKAKWLNGDEYKVIREEIDDYMNARANFEENLFTLMETGVPVYNIVSYNRELFPLCKDYKTTNADGIVHAASTSMGATFAPLGETLGSGYRAQGTYCNNPEHNHISPDGAVDPTTGLLPCTTWYFKGQPHELLGCNDVVLELAIQIITDDNMVDVYSNPDVFPQFNETRLTNMTNTYIAEWEQADKSGIDSEKIKAVDDAILKIKTLEEETIIDPEKWNIAVESLENALIDAGIIEDTEPGAIEKVLTFITKGINKLVNAICA